MTWKGWASIATVVLAIGVGIWIVHLRQQNWLLKDADRVAEIDRFMSLAADAGRRADTFAAEAPIGLGRHQGAVFRARRGFK